MPNYMVIAIPIFDGVAALDAVGPYEILQRLPNVRVRFVGHEKGVVRPRHSRLGLLADTTFEALPSPDVIVFPGGPGAREVLQDKKVLEWLQKAHRTTRFTTSVCTGALVLAAAGLLEGQVAATYWGAYDELRRLGVEPSPERWLQTGKLITSAGVSAGIDMALHLATLLAGERVAKAMQLIAEYDPQPPFDAGSPRVAGAGTVELVGQLRRAKEAEGVAVAAGDAARTVIAIPVFERMTAIDAIGPYEVLHGLPGVEVRFVAHERGAVRTDNAMLGIVADATYDETPAPAVVLVPGGVGTRPLLRDEAVLSWLRKVHETARYTTSVCTGSLVLAAAGILRGREAATHWSCRGTLEQLGARASSERVVKQGKILTAAGASAGIDMALVLAAELAGEPVAKAMQLAIQYDPQPPFSAGSVTKAGPEIVDLALQLSKPEDSGELYRQVVDELEKL